MSEDIKSRFVWTEEAYSLRHFMDLYGHALPQIVMVREGYAGRDDDLHQIGTGEVYWVTSVQKQPRVILKDKQSRCISLPCDNTSLFQLKMHDGKITDPFPLQEAVRLCQHKDDRIAFRKNRKVELYAGPDGPHMEKLGLMHKLDEYEQKYLIGHTMVGDSVLPERVVIPMYVPITVDVATSQFGKSEELFARFISAVEDIVDQFQKTTLQLETGILLFNEVPEGDYAYIEPVFNPKQWPQSLSTRPLPTAPTKTTPVLAVDPMPSTSIEEEETEPEKQKTEWKSLDEIPENMEEFSVEEVAASIKLLKLDSLAVAMAERDVDGDLLVSLDEDILITEFNCSRFDARKVRKFIKGWRPKT